MVERIIQTHKRQFKPPRGIMRNILYKIIHSDITDKTIFFTAFLGGTLAILTIRLIGDNVSAANKATREISSYDIMAIVVAIAILICYFLYILMTKRRSGVSIDRASDNIYYIGLLFTLVSLAYSLTKLSFGEVTLGSRSDQVISFVA